MTVARRAVVGSFSAAAAVKLKRGRKVVGFIFMVLAGFFWLCLYNNSPVCFVESHAPVSKCRPYWLREIKS